MQPNEWLGRGAASLRRCPPGAGASHGEIEELLGRAQSLIEATGADLFGAQLHAELMRGIGDADAHRYELRQAQRLYTEMSAKGYAERMAKELGPKAARR